MKKFINQHNDLKNLQSIHFDLKVPVKGVIHIGAHHGGEISCYNQLGYKNIIFVEPVRSTFDILKSNVESLNTDRDCKIQLINKAFGSYNGKVDMYIEVSNQGQSSSVLKPEFHLIQYPGITFPYRETVILTTLNDEIKNYEDFNFLNIDVQGYELEVLKGSTNILNNIDFINTEVNKIEVYKDCALVHQIDDFLDSFGFVKIDENWMGEVWGDNLYIKKHFMENE